MEIKICTKCRIEKEVCEFRTDKSKKDGYYSSCKDCCSKHRMTKQSYYIERSKNWYNKNSENFNKKRWIKTKNNPEKLEK